MKERIRGKQRVNVGNHPEKRLVAGAEYRRVSGLIRRLDIPQQTERGIRKSLAHEVCQVVTVVGVAGEARLDVKEQGSSGAEFSHIIANLRRAPPGDGLQSPAGAGADYRLARAFLSCGAGQRRSGNLVPGTGKGRVGRAVAGEHIAVKPSVASATSVPARVTIPVRFPVHPRKFKQQVIKNRIGLYALRSRAYADHCLREGLNRIEPAFRSLGEAAVQAYPASEVRQHAPYHVVPAIAVAPFRPRLGK